LQSDLSVDVFVLALLSLVVIAVTDAVSPTLAGHRRLSTS
jgi:hypothetical protein